MTTRLSIETSQRIGGVALEHDDRVTVEQLRTTHGRHRHDDDLLPAIDRLLSRHGVAPRDLRTVGVSIGPGGFTGLRIAVSTAKMLAEALGVRLVAIPSALVVAHAGQGEPGGDGPVLVVLAVKCDGFWATRVRRAGAAWSIAGTPGLERAGEIDLSGVTAVIGDEHLPAALRDACAEREIPVAEPRFDPAALAALVRIADEEDRTIDPLEIAPLYPREPEAVTLWKGREEAR